MSNMSLVRTQKWTPSLPWHRLGKTNNRKYNHSCTRWILSEELTRLLACLHKNWNRLQSCSENACVVEVQDWSQTSILSSYIWRDLWRPRSALYQRKWPCWDSLRLGQVQTCCFPCPKWYPDNLWTSAWDSTLSKKLQLLADWVRTRFVAHRIWYQTVANRKNCESGSQNSTSCTPRDARWPCSACHLAQPAEVVAKVLEAVVCRGGYRMNIKVIHLRKMAQGERLYKEERRKMDKYRVRGLGKHKNWILFMRDLLGFNLHSLHFTYLFDVTSFITWMILFTSRVSGFLEDRK